MSTKQQDTQKEIELTRNNTAPASPFTPPPTPLESLRQGDSLAEVSREFSENTDQSEEPAFNPVYGPPIVPNERFSSIFLTSPASSTATIPSVPSPPMPGSGSPIISTPPEVSTPLLLSRSQSPVVPPVMSDVKAQKPGTLDSKPSDSPVAESRGLEVRSAMREAVAQSGDKKKKRCTIL